MGDSGEVTLLKENGDMKQDLNLPDRVLVGEATEDDKKLTMDIKSAQEAGKDVSRGARSLRQGEDYSTQRERGRKLMVCSATLAQKNSHAHARKLKHQKVSLQ